ncbi:MAG: gene transfer agent family protein [Pseudomonadota bacterium]
MANPVRGEAAITVEGRARRMRLSLGALAELEAAIDAGGLAALAERFEGGAFTTRDLIALLGAGLRGGWDVSDRELANMEIEGGAAGAARAGARLLAATFAPLDPE